MARKEAKKVTVKRQSESRCRQARLDCGALDAFQAYCVQHRSESFEWMGWLLGTFGAQDGSATVHAVYEPPQRWHAGGRLELLEDPMSKRVDQVASMLGLRRVGWVFAHGPRRDALSARVVEFAARQQLANGPQFISVSITLRGGPRSGQQQQQLQAQAEAYQASDQAVDMVARGIITGVVEPAGSALQLSQPVIAEGADTVQLDPAWLTVNVALVAHRGMFATCSFPPANRPDSPQLPADFREHVAAAKKSRCSPFSDWHFLLHVASRDLFDPAADLPIICRSISSPATPGKPQQEEDDISGFLMLLDALSESLH